MTILGGSSVTAAGETRIGIANTAPQTELDVNGAVRFRAPIELCSADPLATTEESGTVYSFGHASAVTFTLPIGQEGVQYVVVNKSGSPITFQCADPAMKLQGAINGTLVNSTPYAGTTLICEQAGIWFAVGGI